MNFCDYCKCEHHEEFGSYHAPTVDGKWICDVCFDYDVCTSGPNRNSSPCDEVDCGHRPILKSEFEKYEKETDN